MTDKIFAVQEHNASHLHWDLRLEINGLLKSWAVPKEPPTMVGIKRLAVEVNDHELSYANFEGNTENRHGKGSVKIWDKGTYEFVEKLPGKYVLDFFGKKLAGKYTLLRFKTPEENDKNWLFFKNKE